jgi:PBP1b-binding outer membrane lipoprotein LpoB
VRPLHHFYAATLGAILFLQGCVAAEPRPAGVSRFISFSVSPVYPKSFEITAASLHSIYGHFSVQELEEAWRKKALEVANGRKFKTTRFVVHDSEDSSGGWPQKLRSVSGTITLID